MRHARWMPFFAALATSAVSGLAPSARAAAKVECHTGGGYFVIGRERTEQAGTDFLVRQVAAAATPPPCVYKQETGDFALADKDKPYWFKDIRSDYLILTESTGPTENVVVFDLQNRRKVLDLTASDIQVDDRGIYFWARTEEATPKTCRKFEQIKKDGLQPVIETKARFIFSEAKMIEIKARRCVAAQ